MSKKMGNNNKALLFSMKEILMNTNNKLVIEVLYTCRVFLHTWPPTILENYYKILKYREYICSLRANGFVIIGLSMEVVKEFALDRDGFNLMIKNKQKELHWQWMARKWLIKKDHFIVKIYGL